MKKYKIRGVLSIFAGVMTGCFGN